MAEQESRDDAGATLTDDEIVTTGGARLAALADDADTGDDSGDDADDSGDSGDDSDTGDDSGDDSAA